MASPSWNYPTAANDDDGLFARIVEGGSNFVNVLGEIELPKDPKEIPNVIENILNSKTQD